MTEIKLLEAHAWFVKRKYKIWGVFICVFAGLLLALSVFFDLNFWLAALIGLIAAFLITYLLEFLWADFKQFGIICDKCGKFIDIRTHWICGYKDNGVEHNNLNTIKYPFINECRHCGRIPKSYICHHCEGLVFLSKDEDKKNPARRLGDVMAHVDPKIQKVEGRDDRIQELKYELDVAKLLKQIAIVNNLSDKPASPEVPSSKIDVHKLAAELEQMALSKFSMQQAKIIVVARLKEYFKDQPHELKQIEPVVDDAVGIINRKNFKEGK